MAPRRKPIGPMTIDKAHGMAKEIAWAQLYGAGEPEIVSGGSYGTLEGTATLAGDGVSIEGGNGWIDLGDPDQIECYKSNQSTWGFVFTPTTSSAYVLLGRSQNNSGNRYMRLRPDPAGGDTQWLAGDGTWVARDIAGYPDDSGLQVCCAVQIRFQGVYEEARLVYSNGREGTLSTGCPNWEGDYANPSTSWQIGTEASGAVGAFRGKIHAFFKWNRGLALEEQRAFCRDPYQFLIPA